MTPLCPIRIHVHPALALLTLAILAVVWHIARRDREVWAPLYAEPEDGVQPWDPETIRRMTFGGNSRTIVTSDNLTTADDPPVRLDWLN